VINVILRDDMLCVYDAFLLLHEAPAVIALILLPWFELTKCCTPSVRLCRLYNLLQIRMP